MPARLIPQGKLYAVPQSELVVDNAQIILHHVFRSANFVGHVTVFQALGDKLDDSIFTLVGGTGSITVVCEHNCLRYNRVASFTRLMPPVIPKRRNNRLKCAFTVLRAIFNWLAISALSQPCKSNSTICCSRGPSRTDCSVITTPWFFGFAPAFTPVQTGCFQIT